jgi:hypothetical protein
MKDARFAKAWKSRDIKGWKGVRVFFLFCLSSWFFRVQGKYTRMRFDQDKVALVAKMIIP